MRFIETKYFLEQLKTLSFKYRLVEDDYKNFVKDFSIHTGIHLGRDTYKFRLKNSSIPTGKRGGFRLIVQIYDHVTIPLIIYAKNTKSNVSAKEIIYALDAVFKEL